MKKENISPILHSFELKATPLRIAFFEIMSHSKKPLSLPEIHFLLEKKVSVDTVSLYRTIKTFLEKSILEKVTDIHKNEFLYEFIYEKKHSHKITCTQCSLVENVEGCEIENIISKLIKKSKKFKKEEKHLFEIFAVCRKCTK
jgi:Fe2+ or Zn2+ uptake regulation protein